ncbi:MAG: RpiB/LacA/LacB family sugar-phosphate isomerase [Candidatus Pacebacteria bacterium]|nr:RpiB/LacA/LacB family sugar-phosphate isomerase [Candidatus Paceibacterota bacterium]MCF7856977.1 RpiB/LacA/LacB family sugar-phosphate isomerase [Candidatus Paceibacterota bacterium]
MTIYFATDHAGFELKEKLITYVRDELGYDVVDCGAQEFVDGDDYPEYIRLAGEAVSKSPHDSKAIIFGGSGQGEAIVANRFPYIRAIVYYGGNDEIIRLSREHNDSNVLSLGARFLTASDAEKAVALWLSTPFREEERHVRRIGLID